MDSCSKSGDRARTGIFVDELIWPFGEGRRIVYWLDHDCHCCRTGLGPPIAGPVGERIHPIEIQRRDIGKAAVGREGQAAMGRQADPHGTQPVPIGIGVIAQHSRRGN